MSSCSILMSEAIVATKNGARYLQQLCRHWAPRFVVQYTAKSGRIDFGEGRTVAFAADASQLSLLARAPDAAGLSQLESNIADLLQRYGFGERLEVNFAPVSR